MLKNNQSGLMDPLVVPLATSVVIIIITLGFGFWSYSQYTDLDKNFDAKVAEAVILQRSEIRETVDSEFRELEKQPLRLYQAPADKASVLINYPKTWSVYADESESGARELDLYLHPGFVRTLDGDNLHALRVTLEDRQYAKVLDSYNRRIEDGELKSSIVKSSGVQGVRLDGLIEADITGSLVLLPVRDKTLFVWTESTEFKADFDRLILPQLSFIP